jgi:hypothetical protein
MNAVTLFRDVLREQLRGLLAGGEAMPIGASLPHNLSKNFRRFLWNRPRHRLFNNSGGVRAASPPSFRRSAPVNVKEA